MIELLIKLSSGDLRRAITLLQSASRLHGATSPPSSISCESGKQSSFSSHIHLRLAHVPYSFLFLPVQEISGNVPDELVNIVLASVGVDMAGGYLGKHFQGGFDLVNKAVKRVKREGWSANTVLSQVSFSFFLVELYLLRGPEL